MVHSKSYGNTRIHYDKRHVRTPWVKRPSLGKWYKIETWHSAIVCKSVLMVVVTLFFTRVFSSGNLMCVCVRAGWSCWKWKHRSFRCCWQKSQRSRYVTWKLFLVVMLNFELWMELLVNTKKSPAVTNFAVQFSFSIVLCFVSFTSCIHSL
jgi:uncharacterized membrane-anchored protein